MRSRLNLPGLPQRSIANGAVRQEVGLLPERTGFIEKTLFIYETAPHALLLSVRGRAGAL
jgi:hypothetical protein